VGAVAGVVRHLSVRRIQAQLEQLERQRAVERDRARIAKDIHDDLGAGLTHIALLSEMARPAAAPELQVQLGQITEVARELTTNMDEIVWAVNPENDTLEGLVTYVSRFAQHYLNVAGIRCRLDVPAQLPAAVLPAEIRHNLYLAIKEALNNVVKHAGATEVSLRLILNAQTFAVVIEDNGCGFASTPPGEGARPGRVAPGQGLPNLQKRLAASGGTCLLSSEPGKGTKIEMTLQLAAPSPELASGETQTSA
jgi:signal transduction histidine kinase